MDYHRRDVSQETPRRFLLWPGHNKLDSNDWFALMGLALLTAGVFFVWWPLALIVPGAILLAVGVSGARRGGD